LSSRSIAAHDVALGMNPLRNLLPNNRDFYIYTILWFARLHVRYAALSFRVDIGIFNLTVQVKTGTPQTAQSVLLDKPSTSQRCFMSALLSTSPLGASLKRTVLFLNEQVDLRAAHERE
jgi:hypothetical protein